MPALAPRGQRVGSQLPRNLRRRRRRPHLGSSPRCGSPPAPDRAPPRAEQEHGDGRAGLTAHWAQAAVAPVLLALLLALLLAAMPTIAYAQATNLGGVIDNIRLWVTGLLAALATLFLMIGGIRYLAAGGNRKELERGKEAMRSAAIGYGLAALAPILITILKQLVGA